MGQCKLTEFVLQMVHVHIWIVICVDFLLSSRTVDVYHPASSFLLEEKGQLMVCMHTCRQLHITLDMPHSTVAQKQLQLPYIFTAVKPLSFCTLAF